MGFSSPKYFEINNKNNYHLIASTYFVDKNLQITYEKLAGNICVMGIRKFIIFYVLDFEQRLIYQLESCENYKGFFFGPAFWG